MTQVRGLSVALMLVSTAAAAQHVEFNLFGSSSSLSLGFGVHHHARRRVVVAPAPVIVQAAPVYVAPPPPVYVAPPAPVYVAPPPPVYVAPPMVAVQPVGVQPVPAVVTRAPTPPAVERPALIGLKYTPGLTGVFSSQGEGDVRFSGMQFSHSAGLEARLSRWFALRSDAEWRNGSRSFDVIGLKVWLAGADWKVKPYLSGSLSGTMIDTRPGALIVGAVGAAGVNVFFGKHFFLEAEVRLRALPDACCSTIPVTTVAGGAGLAFF